MASFSEPDGFLDRPDGHPLDRRDLVTRFAGLRLICAALIFGMCMVAVLIAMVVHFALDGQPLAGNGLQVAGVAVVSWFAVAAALAAPVLAVTVSRSTASSGVAKLAEEKPSGDAEIDGLASIFATATFLEFAITEGVGLACGILYHVTADPLMLGSVAFLAGFLILRFPTTSRMKSWYDAAERTLRHSQGAPG